MYRIDMRDGERDWLYRNSESLDTVLLACLESENGGCRAQ